MRVQLPSAAAPPPATPDPRSQEATSPVPLIQEQPALRERVLAAATRWSVATPVVLLCTVVLCWSLYFRLPASERLLTVNARPGHSTAETNRPVTAQEVTAMRTETLERSTTLIRSRKEIPPILSKLDAKARELGWRCEAALKLPVAAPGGVRELTSHPVAIELRYEYVQPERAYQGLLAWLWTVSSLQPRVEVTAIKLQSLGHGINAAQVELSFYSLNSNEEHPPK